MKNRRSTACLLATFLTTIVVFVAAGPARAEDDLDVIKDRMLQETVRPGVNADRARDLADRLQEDGSWPDIDYENRRRSRWPTAEHLDRVEVLTRAWRKPESPLQGADDMLAAARTSLNYWLKHDFRNPNWWWNEIGVPRTMADILLMMKPELENGRMQKGIEILKRARPSMTGQNLVWVTYITAKRGVLQGDAELVDRAFARIADEIRITEKEGVQPDYSFHQHGACLYNHGYGAGFAADCSRIAALTHGTRFAFSRDKIDTLAAYILDGSRWMTRGTWADPGANGRGITRRGRWDCHYLKSAARNMLNLTTGRPEQFEQLLSRLQDGQPPLTGNRHFWCSDFMTHHRPEYYVSARMYSSRIMNTDGPHNQEGLLSHHVADGCTYIVRDGDEYRRIVPVLDWHKIPGTTVVQKKNLSGSPRRRGETEFVGGVSDGRYGAAAFRFHNSDEKLRARKAWFFFDEAFVCLGAGISHPSDGRVVTTLNQCLLDGEVVSAAADGGRTELDRGEHTLQDASWVLHDRIGYVFPGGADAHLTNREETGSWWRANHQYPKDKVKKDIFTLWLDHGPSPDGVGYSYMVVPDIGADRLADFAGDPPLRIISNEPGLQAVWHAEKKILQAAFHQPGRVELDDGLAVEAEKPCIVMVRGRGGEAKIAVTAPPQKLDALDLAVTVPASDGTAKKRELHIDLPDGPRAGSTAVRTLQTTEN